MSYQQAWIDNQTTCIQSYPLIDAVYESLWGQETHIHRDLSEVNGGTSYQDKYEHIDATLLDGLSVWTIQEKARSYKYSQYSDVTVEYYQDRYTHELGEIEHCKADYFLSCYLSQDSSSLIRWGLCNWQDLREYIYSLSNPVIIPTADSRASFVAVPYANLINAGIMQDYMYNE